MTNKPRIASILNADNLDLSIPGVKAFELSDLYLSKEYDFTLPTNLRLGHLAEKVVSKLIRLSNNFKVIYENVQIGDEHKTIGELDFIIENNITREIIHLEMAYKFYLYDPAHSSDSFHNWIGPNRNDSLKEKLDKLENKQFPLLYNDLVVSKMPIIEVSQISQALCFLVSLYIPYGYQGQFDTKFERAIKGYYLNFEKFTDLDNPNKKYHLPSKTEWGIDPKDNEIWSDFNTIKTSIARHVNERQSILCWEEFKGTFSSFFIVWW